MNWFASPSVAEDRLAALRDAAAVWERHRLIPESERKAIQRTATTPWRRYGPAVSAVFFVLTALFVTALFGMCELLHLPRGAITATLSIVAGELLIRKARFFGTGIESALWLGGLLAIVFDLPRSGRPEALLVFAAAFAVAALRVRNALIGSVAMVLLVVYCGAKVPSLWLPMLFGMSVALGAALALQRAWQRQWNEQWLAALTVVMPAAGYLVGRVADRGLRVSGITASVAATGLLLLTAPVLLALGLRGRDRILLVAGSSTILLAVIENWRRIDWSMEAKCITAGLLLASVGVMLSRVLRARSDGFVVTAVDAGAQGSGELLQISGTLVLSHASTDGETDRVGGGGGFGGGGASGDY